MQLPFIHLNLHFNPFGELTPEQRKKLAVVDLLTYQDALYEKGVAIQFCADHGRGKTTHLLALHQLYPDVEYLKLHSGDRPEIYSQKIRFVDSVENLPKRQRMNLYKNTASIALTSHTDLSKELKRAGYRVIKRSISTVDDQMLYQIFNTRIEYARRAVGVIPVVDIHTVRILRSRFGDNIRAMEASLYHKFQSMPSVSGAENVNM